MKPLGHWLSALMLLLCSSGIPAKVTYTLPDGPFQAGQAFNIEYRSDGPTELPDLSPLEADFHIQNRSVRRFSSTINGHQQQVQMIRLRLVPRRVGQLTLPALRFGSESSTAAQIQVTAQTGTEYSPAYTSEPDWTPAPDWSAGDDTGPAPSVAAPMATPASPAPTQATQAGIWPWLTALCLLAWALTGWWGWRRGRPQPAPATPAPAPQPSRSVTPQTQPIDASLGAIESAFLAADAIAARQALLDWARLRWPQNPPGNLSRLAARCDGDVKAQILKLEAAHYAPEANSDWSRHPIWKQLPATEPNQQDQPGQPSGPGPTPP